MTLEEFLVDKLGFPVSIVIQNGHTDNELEEELLIEIDDDVYCKISDIYFLNDARGIVFRAEKQGQDIIEGE